MSMTATDWNLFLHGALPGSYNMAVDEVLLDRVSDPSCPPTTFLRFYQWKRPTLSLGFSQKASRVVNFPFCEALKIDLVRRITGGKAVLHDQELTYAVISNDAVYFPGNDIATTYERIALALSFGLDRLGIKTTLAPGVPSAFRTASTPSCFATANHFEILCRGQKLVGSAQRRTRRGFLQHGSILIDFDFFLLDGAMEARPNGASSSKNITSLRKILGRLPEVSQVIEVLRQGFEAHFGVKLGEALWGPDLEESAVCLSISKYSCLEWSVLPKLA
jgi:lipoyl(octanoyl) transferase